MDPEDVLRVKATGDFMLRDAERVWRGGTLPKVTDLRLLSDIMRFKTGLEADVESERRCCCCSVSISEVDVNRRKELRRTPVGGNLRSPSSSEGAVPIVSSLGNKGTTGRRRLLSDLLSFMIPPAVNCCATTGPCETELDR